MYVNEKMKLNGFVDVYIPTNKDLYAQFGGRNLTVPGNVGKDGNFAEPVNVLRDKLTTLQSGQNEVNKSFYAARAKAAEEARKQNAQAQPGNDVDESSTSQSE